jgi:hypothetical protein
MWQSLMDWLPDIGVWQIDFGTVTDLFGLVLGCIVLAFTMSVARRQFRIMHKQTEMMERAEGIAIRQEAMAQKQAEIAEAQHRIMQEQIARQANPRIYMTGGQTGSDGHKLSLYVQNRGSRTLRDFHLEVLVPERLKGDITIHIHGGLMDDLPFVVPPDEPSAAEDFGAHVYRRVFGYCTTPVHPGQPFELGHALVREPALGSIYLKWTIDSEDGTFPKSGKPGDVATADGGPPVDV